MCTSLSGLGKGLSDFQKIMVGARKASAFVHCQRSVVSIFTCESSPLLYTFSINNVAVTFGFVISLLSKKKKLF